MISQVVPLEPELSMSLLISVDIDSPGSKGTKQLVIDLSISGVISEILQMGY